MPALEKPGLPPITKTIFDQIDSPFGDPEDLSTDAADLAFESDQAVPADDLEDSAPLPMPAFLAPPQPNPFPVSEPTETFLGEEAVVGPAVPFSVAVDVEKGEPGDEKGEPSDPAGQAPDPIPPSEPPVRQEKENLLDHPELRPLNEIRPYYDYFPDGSELHSAGPAATKVPVEQSLPEEGSLDRAFGGTSFMWAASNLYHNPLYFEDPELERYGHDHGFLQPAASIAKFGVQLVGMPYQLALDPPASRVYSLGWYRPQEICTPKKKSRIPFNAKAAATAAGAYTGLIFIFP